MKKMILLSIITTLILSVVGCGSDANSEIGSSVNDSESEISEIESTEEVKTEIVSEDITENISEIDNQEEVKLVQYKINQIEFSVPETYKLLTQSEDILSFQVTENEKDRLMIKSEIIPDIMKINTGSDNCILNKEDVIEHYATFNLGNITKFEWINNDGFEFCDVYFTPENDTRKGHSIVIPINETYAYFTALAMTEKESDLECVNVLIENIKSLGTPMKNIFEISEVEKYYNIAVNLSPDDCVKINDNIVYDLSVILVDYNGQLLKDKNNLSQSTLYMSLRYGMAACAMSDEETNYTDKIMPHITTKTFDTQLDLENYVVDCCEWMTDSWFAPSCFEKFNTLNCVDINEKDNIYTCIISDTAKCAEELNISEEMLGYIIAALEATGSTTKFNCSQCEIKYKDYDNRINLS